MRPVQRPAWQANWEGRRFSDVVLHALGRFCSACEQPLPQHAIAWDVERWAPLEAAATASRWGKMLVLCEPCADAAASTSAGTPPRIDLPDRDLTFRLGPGGSLSYELRTLRVVGAGGTLEPLGEVDRVVAVADGAQAQRTIDAFALNTPYLDGADVLSLPEGRDLQEVEFLDPRLELRTAAWRDAERCALLLGDATAVTTARQAIETTMAAAVAHRGFWSVWATVLWRTFEDRRLLSKVLLPPEHAPGSLGAGPPRSTPIPSAFPATRAAALLSGQDDHGDG
jgi:hypothetical protein